MDDKKQYNDLLKELRSMIKEHDNKSDAKYFIIVILSWIIPIAIVGNSETGISAAGLVIPLWIFITIWLAFAAKSEANKSFVKQLRKKYKEYLVVRETLKYKPKFDSINSELYRLHRKLSDIKSEINKMKNQENPFYPDMSLYQRLSSDEANEINDEITMKHENFEKQRDVNLSKLYQQERIVESSIASKENEKKEWDEIYKYDVRKPDNFFEKAILKMSEGEKLTEDYIRKDIENDELEEEVQMTVADILDIKVRQI